MLGTFFGLETAVRGLSASQAALDVISNNVDNANTPGYSRQVASLSSSQSIGLTGEGPISTQIGTGVQVEQITRIRNGFLDTQYQQQNQSVGNWTVQQNTLNQVTAIVNEPSSTGLSTVMQNFWNAWSQLGSNPGSLSAATQLQQDGATVTSTLNQMGQQYAQLTSDLVSQRKTTVDQVNSDLSQIAAVNQEIQAVQNIGGQPNDLLDQRGKLLDSLSNLVDVKTSTASDGSFQVSIGSSNALAVQGNTVKASLAVPTDPPSPSTASTVYTTDMGGGQIKGIENSLNIVTSYSTDLNMFANQLANGGTTVTLAGAWQFPMPAGGQFPVSGTLPDGTPFGGSSDTTTSADKTIADFTSVPDSSHPDDKVTIDTSVTPNLVTVPAGTVVNVNGLNGLLKLGYSQNGQVSGNAADFFEANPATAGSAPITAANITVGVNAGQVGYALRPTMTTDAQGNRTWSPSNPGLSGDGTLAMTATTLQNATLKFSNPNHPQINMSGSMNEFLQAEVGQLGIDSQSVNNQVTNQTSLLQQVDTQRQSVSGVSLDEEMANMIKYQQAYNASAKMVATVSAMLDTLINNV